MLIPLLAAALLSQSQPQPQPQVQTKLLNWNTYHLFDYKAHTDPASEWIASRAPTIVALQEVLGVNAEGLAEIAEQWGHPHVVMHKEHGYPVALTSIEPIEVVRRQVEGFHHGYLHARTQGLDVLVVHFWPTKPHEAVIVAEYARSLVEDGRAVVIAGDFNAVTQADEAYFDRVGWEKRDYTIMNAFLDLGFVDLVQEHSPDDDYSFGAPALIPRWADTMDEVVERRHRIDFVLADPATAQRFNDADIITDDATVGKWSDHYPMLVTEGEPTDSSDRIHADDTPNAKP